MHHLHPASDTSSSSTSTTIGSYCSDRSCDHCHPAATFAQAVMPDIMDFLGVILDQAFWSGAAPDTPAPGDAAVALLAAARASEAPPEPQQTLHCVSGLQDHTAAALACAEGCVRYLAATISSQSGGSAESSFLAVARLLQPYVASGRAVRPSSLACLAIAAGPGSPEQRQLYSLLCSVLKLGREIGSQGLRQAWSLPAVMQQLTAQNVAAALKSVLTDAGRTAAGTKGGSAAAADGSASVGQQQQQQFLTDLGVTHSQYDAAAYNALDDPLLLLPNAVLFGRVCCSWAEQLQVDAPLLLRQQAARPQLLVDASKVVRATQEPTSLVGITCFDQVEHGLTELQVKVQTYIRFFEHPRVSELLLAQQYKPQQVLQVFESMLAAWQAAADSTSADPAALSESVEKLQAVGAELSTFAVPHFCNNPACSKVRGWTEAQAVGGRGCLCAGCLTAQYCDKVCQKRHWKLHKAVCRALAAARVAASGEVGAGTAAVGAAAGATGS
jgi:hypothetical protein